MGNIFDISNKEPKNSTKKQTSINYQVNKQPPTVDTKKSKDIPHYLQQLQKDIFFKSAKKTPVKTVETEASRIAEGMCKR